MPHTKRIHRTPLVDRPRVKMQRRGSGALSDFELLEVIIGKGNRGADVGYIARQIQKLLHKGLGSLSYESLIALKGVGPALAGEILAAFEVTRRFSARDTLPLNNTRDILSRLDDIRTKQQEYLVCLSLDGGQRLIAQRIITIGTLDLVVAHPREIFSDPLADRAATIILAHNHPSGDVRPSSKDIELTQQLAAAGQLLGVPLSDHIIVGKDDHFSFSHHHML